ncbi:TasA family protein [Tenuibacillus multivorans]|uniref:Spore coat-associated protein N n=1 Tax=Tenuibacillus multivorans TaxID=237069 RepID=A0A1G9WWH0_9BACI|nr:TasA family protein [Tenuibacillus multivorans]GEL78410.1 spore coat-associated protein N [Tenuibacillus multivorans]SDM88453.1 spore coat-associated protein N [Tenuibacillus multivorans]
MKLKKNLIMASMSAALGLALVAGGTFAAFNDVEDTNASFATGTLKMDLSEYDGPYTFDVSNLKPGDHITRDIEFVNNGSLAIKEVLMAIESVDFQTPEEYFAVNEMEAPDDAWVDQANEDVLEYLNQFKVSIITLGAESGGNYEKDLIDEEDNVTLKDFYLASDSIYGDGSKDSNSTEIAEARNAVYSAINDSRYMKGHRLNVTTETNDSWEGLPLNPYDEDVLRLKVEFIDNTDEMLVVDGEETNEYYQNIFQANSATLTFSFEATQWDGQEITEEDLGENGYIETNEEANNGE